MSHDSYLDNEMEGGNESKESCDVTAPIFSFGQVVAISC